MSRIAEAVAAYAAPLAEQLHLSLWHVEYGKEAGGYVLRITIDKPSGVTTDDCEAMSRAVDPWLDQENLISGSYTLEVSSPGVERVLHTAAQRRRYIGSKVCVRLHQAVDKQRVFTGVLTSCEPDIAVDCGGRNYTFANRDVALIRLVYEPLQTKPGGDEQP